MKTTSYRHEISTIRQRGRSATSSHYENCYESFPDIPLQVLFGRYALKLDCPIHNYRHESRRLELNDA
jgi:hypothetical protein